MATRMLQRRGTAAEWSAANPVLAEGEIGYVTDTRVIKMGDGTSTWNVLPALTVSKALDSDRLGGLLPSAFLSASGKAADSNLLDGLDSTDFVRSSNGVAFDSARLGGILAASYARTNAAVTFAETVTLGDADTDFFNTRAIEVETHTRNTTNTYTNGRLTQVIERAGATTVKTTTLNYSGDLLSSVVETVGGKTITTTMSYTSGVLTGTTRTVV